MGADGDRQRKKPLVGKEFSGPLSMKHVGICTQDGPEEKTGEIRFQISAFSSHLEAKLLVEGIECTYSARVVGPLQRDDGLP